MIAGKLHTAIKEPISPIIVDMLSMLASTDWQTKAIGEYPIDGDSILYHVQEYHTYDHSEIDAEIHKQYCDIQYVSVGAEMIGWAPFSDSVEYTKPYNEEQDIAMIQPPHFESLLVMNSGSFAFFAPYEIHRPRLQLLKKQSEQMYVKKVVVKIKSSVIYG